MVGYFEPERGRAFDPTEIVRGCIEHGSRGVLLDEEGIPPEFFDLSSRLAGELLHRLSMYGVRLAAVVPDPGVHSEPAQDFIREANRGESFRFFRTRDEAIDLLRRA